MLPGMEVQSRKGCTCYVISPARTDAGLRKGFMNILRVNRPDFFGQRVIMTRTDEGFNDRLLIGSGLSVEQIVNIILPGR